MSWLHRLTVYGYRQPHSTEGVVAGPRWGMRPGHRSPRYTSLGLRGAGSFSPELMPRNIVRRPILTRRHNHPTPTTQPTLAGRNRRRLMHLGHDLRNDRTMHPPPQPTKTDTGCLGGDSVGHTIQ